MVVVVSDSSLGLLVWNWWKWLCVVYMGLLLGPNPSGEMSHSCVLRGETAVGGAHDPWWRAGCGGMAGSPAPLPLTWSCQKPGT